MEAAASVAGLLGLAGLVIQGVTTLQTFCSNFEGASQDATDAIRDLRGIQNILEQLSTFPKHDAFRSSTIAMLEREVQECGLDVDRWVGQIAKLDPSAKKRLKRFKSKASSAFKHAEIVEMRGKTASHRSQLTILVEMLGRELDLQNSHHLSALKQSHDTNSAHVATSLDSIQAGIGKLQLTTSSLNSIETRLRSMQTVLMQSLSRNTTKNDRSGHRNRQSNQARASMLRPSKRKPSCAPSQIADENDSVECSTTLVRIVKTAILVQESQGKPFMELLATTDRQYENATDYTKITMIQQLQGLRLITWLLRGENLMLAARFAASTEGSSLLGKNGALTCTHRKAVVANESLRRQQFLLVQDMITGGHDLDDLETLEDIVRHYFLSNSYGMDLFQYYLSRHNAVNPDQDEVEIDDDTPDSAEPDWMAARADRVYAFSKYLGNHVFRDVCDPKEPHDKWKRNPIRPEWTDSPVCSTGLKILAAEADTRHSTSAKRRKTTSIEADFSDRTETDQFENESTEYGGQLVLLEKSNIDAQQRAAVKYHGRLGYTVQPESPRLNLRMQLWEGECLNTDSRPGYVKPVEGARKFFGGCRHSSRIQDPNPTMDLDNTPQVMSAKPLHSRLQDEQIMPTDAGAHPTLEDEDADVNFGARRQERMATPTHIGSPPTPSQVLRKQNNRRAQQAAAKRLHGQLQGEMEAVENTQSPLKKAKGPPSDDLTHSSGMPSFHDKYDKTMPAKAETPVIALPTTVREHGALWQWQSNEQAQRQTAGQIRTAAGGGHSPSVQLPFPAADSGEAIDHNIAYLETQIQANHAATHKKRPVPNGHTEASYDAWIELRRESAQQRQVEAAQNVRERLQRGKGKPVIAATARTNIKIPRGQTMQVQQQSAAAVRLHADLRRG